MKNLLNKLFNSNPKIEELFSIFDNDKNSNLLIKGLSGSSKSFLFAKLSQVSKTPICVILPDKEKASYFYDDLNNIIDNKNILFYPSAYKRSIEYLKTDKTNIVLKTEVLNKIISNKKPYTIITYPGAIIEKVVPNKTLTKNTLEIHQGEKISMDFVIEVLNEYGFSAVDFVYEPGNFSVRGSLIDIFSFAEEFPFRIDFFGDEIESIRSFDPQTQLSTNKHKKIKIIPNLHEHFEEIEKISFFDFISKNCKFWISEPELVLDKIEKTFVAAEKRYEEIDENIFEDEDNYILEPSKNLLKVQDFINQIKNFQLVEIASRSVFEAKKEFNFNTEPQPKFGKQFNILAEILQNNETNAYETYVLSNNEKQLLRLKDIFIEQKQNVNFIPILKIVNQGFIMHEAKVCVFTDHQIFERYHRFSNKKLSHKDSITIQELTALKPGDYVVHIDNGVGKFGGLQKINNNGKIQEVVSIIYDNNDILYVNIHSLHRISKYRDKDDEAPKIYRLGSGHWKRLKEKTKKNIKDIAKDLILLYAKRREQKGFAFSPDSYLQHQLESSFMYEDTEDQSKSNELIKADMESEIPMDRLVCGDVGFGKTELAIRAAFKAVNDSKQVAVLVPTTILALQHYQTFKERLADMPVNVSYISRLKSNKEIKENLEKLEEGKLDIIIGTHRLLNKDVIFKDLGLLIIDEEQKFGVSMKEKLKNLKVNVDTLTLTATPIPRTLQFSLMGARDLSVINTAPPNRQPIITELHSFNNEIIKDAIYYEVGRNGQVFFINNRIQNIFEIQALVNKLCPEVKTIVAHGQMEGQKLEKIILSFVRGDYDVLISTTIIENGIDIPNVNMIIVENSDHYGLAQLYQIKGRVGRSDRISYAYLMYDGNKILTEKAQKRLQAIKDFTALGSGYKIAQRDLMIRGAGDILGPNQAGFIDSIGLDMYIKLLNEAVKEKMTGAVEQNEIETPINFAIDAYIPDEYASEGDKIDLYQTIKDAKSSEALADIEMQMRDIYGKTPPQVKLLLKKQKIEILKDKAEIESMRISDVTINLTLGKEYLDIKGIGNLLFEALIPFIDFIKISYTQKRFNISMKKRKTWLDDLYDILQSLLEIIESASKMKE